MTSLAFDHGQRRVMFSIDRSRTASGQLLKGDPDVDVFLDAEFVGIAGLAITGQSVPMQVSSTSFSTDD